MRQSWVYDVGQSKRVAWFAYGTSIYIRKIDTAHRPIRSPFSEKSYSKLSQWLHHVGFGSSNSATSTVLLFTVKKWKQCTEQAYWIKVASLRLYMGWRMGRSEASEISLRAKLFFKSQKTALSISCSRHPTTFFYANSGNYRGYIYNSQKIIQGI